MKYLITQKQRDAILSIPGYSNLKNSIRELKPVEPLTPTEVKELGGVYSSEDLCGWSYRMGIGDAEAHILGEKHDS